MPNSTIESMLSSLGECNTTTVEPSKHIAHPILPSKFNFSFSKRDDRTVLQNKIYITLRCQLQNTHVTSTDSAPNGVTRLAGAKAYAMKLNASPTPTVKELIQKVNIINLQNK
jgi:hypothetical protein